MAELTKKKIKQIEELFGMKYKTIKIRSGIKWKCFITKTKSGYSKYFYILSISDNGVKYYTYNKILTKSTPNSIGIPIDKLISLAKILEGK